MPIYCCTKHHIRTQDLFHFHNDIFIAENEHFPSNYFESVPFGAFRRYAFHQKARLLRKIEIHLPDISRIFHWLFLYGCIYWTQKIVGLLYIYSSWKKAQLCKGLQYGTTTVNVHSALVWNYIKLMLKQVVKHLQMRMKWKISDER